MKKSKTLAGGTALAMVMMGGLVGLTTAPAAMAAPGDDTCSANFLIEQDLTFSFSEKNIADTKSQLTTAVKKFKGSAVDATAGISSFGWVSPVITGPTLTGARIDTAAGNKAMVDQIAKYKLHETTGRSHSERTNWEEGLVGALRNAKNQKAKTIIFVTDGVPNTYNGNPNESEITYNPTAAAKAKTMAAKIRAEGITLVPVFIKTNEPNRGGMLDPNPDTRTSNAQITSAMKNLDSKWTINNAVDIASLSSTILAQANASCAPGISLVKTHAKPVDVNKNGRTDLGDTVVFNFVAKNTGDLPLTNVKVTDPKLAAAGVTLANGGVIGTLGTGKSATIKSNPYKIKQADVEAGTFNNVATVTGNSPKGNPKATDDDKVPVKRAPAISLVKSHKASDVVDVNKNGRTDAGDTVVFNFLTKNTGNLKLTNVTVTDPKLTAAGVALEKGGKLGALNPGQSVNIKSAPYKLTQGDVDAGIFKNVATSTGQSTGGAVNATDNDSVSPDQTPGIEIVKSHKDTDIIDVNEDKIVNLGDTVKFTLVATNTGVLTLNNVVITDDILAKAGVKLSNDGKVGTLAPGKSGTVTSEPYTLTQADVDSGTFVNVGVATGQSPKGPVKDDDDDKVPTDGTPAVELIKSHADTDIADVNESGTTDLGDTVVFTFEATNTGTVTLDDVVVTDETLAAAGVALENEGKVGSLSPGITGIVKSLPYTLTQADVDKGEFLNLAVVNANSPKGPVKDEDDDVVPVLGTPGIEIVKSHEETDIVDVNENKMVDTGDTVVFTLVTTNTGTLTLHDVNVTDPILEAAGVKLVDEGKIGVMAPGASVTLKSEPYTLTQADVDTGEFANVAIAVGTSPRNNCPDPGVIAPEPEVAVADAENPEAVDPAVCAPTTVTDEDDDVVPTQAEPGITLVKSHEATDIVDVNGNGKTDLGDTVVFTLVTQNTGNVTLKDVTIFDKTLDEAGVALENEGKVGDLAPGASATVKSAPYTVTQANVDAGTFLNIATVTGTNPLDPDTPVTTEDDDIVPVEQSPGIGIVKTAKTVVDVNDNKVTDAGDTIVWEVVVTNPGTVTWHDGAVTDEMLDKANITLAPSEKWDGVLAPGGSVTLLSDPYTITKDDAKAGTVHNVAMIDAKGPQDQPLNASSEAIVKLGVEPKAAIVPNEPTVVDKYVAVTGGEIQTAVAGENNAPLVIALGIGGVLLVGGATFVLIRRRKKTTTPSE